MITCSDLNITLTCKPLLRPSKDSYIPFLVVRAYSRTLEKSPTPVRPLNRTPLVAFPRPTLNALNPKP